MHKKKHLLNGWFICARLQKYIYLYLILSQSLFTFIAAQNNIVQYWDKAAHFQAGALISSSITFKIRNKHENSPLIGISAGIAVTWLKEVLDAYGLGHPSMGDIKAGMAGSVVGGISCTMALNPQHSRRWKKKHPLIKYENL